MLGAVRALFEDDVLPLVSVATTPGDVGVQEAALLDARGNDLKKRIQALWAGQDRGEAEEEPLSPDASQNDIDGLRGALQGMALWSGDAPALAEQLWAAQQCLLQETLAAPGY